MALYMKYIKVLQVPCTSTKNNPKKIFYMSKDKEENKMKKLLKFIFIVFIIYVLISFIDVNLHNNIPGDPQNIAPWNIFNIFCK